MQPLPPPLTLHNKDCVELLLSLPDESVDLILVDPPYFEIAHADWDHQWAFEEDYLQWCSVWSKECARVLKPNRMFAVWGTTKTDTFLKYKLNILNSIEELKYRNWIIWHYDWGGRPRNNFARKHEDCLVYSKGNDWLFNDENIRIPYKLKKNVRPGAANHSKGKIPTSVWEKNNHTTSKEYVSWHPTQKPLMILKRIIEAYTNPGDIVLDCFSGSGSTMIACDHTNRKFIGSELDITYYEKSIERYNICKSPPNLEKMFLST